MQIGNDARGEFHLDLEVHDDDDVGERDDVGELGVDLGALMADLHLEDRLPGLLEIGERAEHDALDEAVFDGGKLAALDLEARLSRAAEENVHQRKDHLRLDDEDGAAPERLHPEDVKARRDGKGLQKLAELHHLDGQRAHPDNPAQKRRKAQPEQAGEFLRRHLEGGHPPPDDPVLACQVIGKDIAGLVKLDRDRCRSPRPKGLLRGRLSLPGRGCWTL